MTTNLYEYGIEEILGEGIGITKIKDEKKRTTVVLPQQMRLELKDLKKRFGWSMKDTIDRVVTHGCSILQHGYKSDLKIIEEATTTLRRPELGTIRNFMHELSVSVDGMEKPARFNIEVNSGILSAITNTAQLLRVEQSSMIRLCIYISLATLSDSYTEMKNISLTEIQKFERRIAEIAVTYEGFTITEEIWKKRNGS